MLLSREFDRMAAGPEGPDPRVPRPLPGKRCHRCHTRIRPARCALCNPPSAAVLYQELLERHGYHG